MTRELTERDRVEILLVFGAKIKTVRGPRPDEPGRPGIRVTAGYHDGAVLLEAVGFPEPSAAYAAICEARQACKDAGLFVAHPPRRMSNYPARVVYRR